MIRKSDLRKARSKIVKCSNRDFPASKAQDTIGPSIEAALVVTQFDVDAAMLYSVDLANRNRCRIQSACARGEEPMIDLFAAAIASGLAIGAQAARNELL